MRRKLTPLLACPMVLSLTVCGGGNKAAEAMAIPKIITATTVEAARGESRGDAAEITAARATGGDMDALTKATKTEGELIVYGSCEKEYLSAACQDFEKLCGIKTKYQRLSISEVYTKISEKAGKSSTDVWFGGATGPCDKAVADGLLMEYNVINVKNLADDQCKDLANCWYGIYKDALGFMADTEELDRLGLEAPKIWDDLTKGEHKGLIMLSSLDVAGTAKLLISTVVQMKGHNEAMGYFKVLDKNTSQYTKSGSGPSKMVDPGECVIGIGFLHDGIYQIPQGYDNIQLIVPEDGISFKVGATAILDGCAYLNTAKLWTERALSPGYVDHTKENGSYQFLVLSNATQPKEATKFGLDMNSTIDYGFESAKENSAKYVENFLAALGSPPNSADSSRFLTE